MAPEPERTLEPMRLWGCTLVVLVACSKPSGVVLDVTAPSNVDTVRVYIGTQQIDGVPGLTVPDATGTVSRTGTQNVYQRDPNNATDVHAYEGGTLSFEFQAGDATSIPGVIVVGYSQGVPVAAEGLTNLALQGGVVDRYPVMLQPIDNPSHHLFLWSPGTTELSDAACAGITGDTVAFVVTAGDTDCDGFLDGSDVECNPFFYRDQNATAGLTNGQCFSTADHDGNVPECKLGAAACVDGVGVTSGMCTTHNTICMPGPDCGCVPTGSNTPLDCLLEAGSAMPDYFGYDCSAGSVNQSCSIELPRAPTGGFGCVPPGNGGSQTGIATKGTGTFDDKVTIGNVTYQLQVTDDCAVSLVPSASAMTPGDSTVFLRLDLTNGSSLVIPIDLATMPATASCGSCTTVGTIAEPELTACVAGWTPIGSTAIAGHSPTLNAAMTEMFYLAAGSGSDGDVIAMATRGSSDPLTKWTPMPAQVVAPASVTGAQFIHMSRDGMHMWVVDSTDTIEVLSRAGSNTWVTDTTRQPPTIANVTAYAPDDSATDAIAATADTGLLEMPNQQPLGTGRTPFLADDDVTMWYADTPSGATAGTAYAIFVQSRSTKMDSLAHPSTTSVGPVQIDQLGISTQPMEPWVAPDLRTMFYSSDATQPRAIYSATR